MKYLGQLGDDIAIGYTLIVGGGLGGVEAAAETILGEGSSEAVEQEINEGIYEFKAASGDTYVG
jgi:hypothetical protein